MVIHQWDGKPGFVRLFESLAPFTLHRIEEKNVSCQFITIISSEPVDSATDISLTFYGYFPSKFFFRKENFRVSSRRFFLFLKLPMTRRVQVCRVVGVLYKTCDRCHRVSNPAIDHTFF